MKKRKDEQEIKLRFKSYFEFNQKSRELGRWISQSSSNLLNCQNTAWIVHAIRDKLKQPFPIFQSLTVDCDQLKLVNLQPFLKCFYFQCLNQIFVAEIFFLKEQIVNLM